MRIVYIGSKWGTSLHRAHTLERLGHQVVFLDPQSLLKMPQWLARLHFHSGYAGIGLCLNNRLLHKVSVAAPDLIWVNQGEFLGPGIVQRLHRMGIPIINYANDNPFSFENRKRFARYRAALPYYDLVVVVFEESVQFAEQLGAKHVVRVYLSADEAAHTRRTLTSEQKRRYSSEVAFVGTWMADHRGQFIATLIRRGVPLSIWGDRWQKAPEWPLIQSHWRGFGVYDDDGYGAIIQSAKICLGLVNKASGNLHTGRSVQIPALGALLCAERTDEHVAMYDEGTEAIFWNDADECADKCLSLLKQPELCKQIAKRGHERCLKNNYFNEPTLKKIIDCATRKES